MASPSAATRRRCVGTKTDLLAAQCLLCEPFPPRGEVLYDTEESDIHDRECLANMMMAFGVQGKGSWADKMGKVMEESVKVDPDNLEKELTMLYERRQTLNSL